MSAAPEQVQIDESWMDQDPEGLATFERHSVKAQLVQLVKASDALVENDWRLGQLLELLKEWLTRSPVAPDDSAISLMKAIGDLSMRVGNAAFTLRTMTASVARQHGCAQGVEILDDDQMDSIIGPVASESAEAVAVEGVEA
jgi:hypothetical protein